MNVLDGIFRYFWFIGAAVMLINVALMRPRVTRLVELGRLTQDEADEFMRGAALAFGVPCVAFGLIGLWARWPSPLCAGILSFRDPPSTATAVVVLAIWALLLRWIWIGSGAVLLSRVGPALMNPPNWERTYSPTLVRWFITVVVLVAAIGGTIAYRATPPDLRCAVPSAAA